MSIDSPSADSGAARAHGSAPKPAWRLIPAIDQDPVCVAYAQRLPGRVVMFVAAVALSGAVLGVIYLGARRVVAAPSARRPQHFIARALRAEQWRIHRAGPLPYALAIAAGFLFIAL